LQPALAFTLVVPLADNDGQPLAPEHLAWAKQEVSHYAGGLTQYASSEGIWIDETGRRYKDPIQIHQFVVPTAAAVEGWLAGFALELARRCQQQAIFLFTQPVWILVSAPLMVEETIPGIGA
jgi:hypothetical protein